MDYEEKLALAKEALESGSYDTETIEYIFPELKKNDYESTRERIIALVNAHGQGRFKESMLAWLEKQGEQKPAWSEYDEEYLRRAIKATKDVYPMTADWLKSLKERMKGE